MKILLLALICLSFVVDANASLDDLARPDATWIKSLEIYHRTNKPGDDPGLSELLVNEKGPATKNIPAIPEYKGLLPQRFRLGQEKEISALVDAITLKLFESAKIRSSLCFLGAEATSDFSHFLGVQSKSAQKLKVACRSNTVSEADRKRLSMMKSRFLDSPTWQRPKRFGLVLSLSDIPMIEGFTTRDGITLVLIPVGEISSERVLRIWIHELAMTFDQLSAMATVTSAEAWSTGLNEILGLDRYEDPPLVGGVDKKALGCALRDPAIRYGMAAERAFRFEDDVMEELGLLITSPALNMRMSSCERTIGVRAVQISPLASSLQREINKQLFYEECGGVELLKDAKRSETLVSRIRLIGQTKIIVSSKERPLCEFILEPHVGPRIPDSSRHNGPRPRIGGWE